MYPHFHRQHSYTPAGPGLPMAPGFSGLVAGTNEPADFKAQMDAIREDTAALDTCESRRPSHHQAHTWPEMTHSLPFLCRRACGNGHPDAPSAEPLPGPEQKRPAIAPRRLLRLSESQHRRWFPSRCACPTNALHRTGPDTQLRAVRVRRYRGYVAGLESGAAGGRGLSGGGLGTALSGWEHRRQALTGARRLDGQLCVCWV